MVGLRGELGQGMRYDLNEHDKSRWDTGFGEVLRNSAASASQLNPDFGCDVNTFGMTLQLKGSTVQFQKLPSLQLLISFIFSEVV